MEVAMSADSTTIHRILEILRHSLVEAVFLGTATLILPGCSDAAKGSGPMVDPSSTNSQPPNVPAPATGDPAGRAANSPDINHVENSDAEIASRRPNATPALSVQHVPPRQTVDDATKQQLIARAADLVQLLELLRNEGRVAEFQKPADELIDVRTRLYGDDSWQVRLLRSQMVYYRWILSLDRPGGLQAFNEATVLDETAHEEDRKRHYGSALQAAENEMEMLSSLHQPDTVFRATLLQFIGKQRWLAADYHGYEKAVRQSSTIMGESVGRVSPHYAESLMDLSRYYKASGDFAESLRLGEQASAVFASAVGENDPGYASYLLDIASIEGRIGCFDRAERHALKAVELARTAGGVPNDLYVDCTMALANLYCATEKYSAAEPLLIEARSYLEKHYDAADNRCIYVRVGLGQEYAKTHRYEQAKPILAGALSLAQATYGEASGRGEFSAAAQGLGEMYLMQKNLAEAEPLLRHSLELQEKRCGKNNPWLISILRSNAELMRSTERTSEANELDRRRHALEDSVAAVRAHFQAIWSSEEHAGPSVIPPEKSIRSSERPD
jgi:tetratricopeptide (TPR) repeat protein